MILTVAEAIGYSLFAAKEIGLTIEQMRKLEKEIKKQIDSKTEEEALEYYYYYDSNYYYNNDLDDF